jgi:hypothetical protein
MDLLITFCAGMAAAAGFARAIGGVGGNFPRLVLQALPRARRRAAAKRTGRSPWGDHKAQWGEFITKVRVAHTLLVDPKCNVGSNSLGV